MGLGWEWKVPGPQPNHGNEWKHYPAKSDRSKVGKSAPTQVSFCGDRSLKLK
ncbi:MAG: hypothetical protein ACRC8Y_23900 [Chroococcales cyanobacterium]